MQDTSLARVRVFHAAAHAPAVDLLFDRSPVVTTPYLIANLAYGRISPYVPITPGRHRFKLFQAGCDGSKPAFFEAEIPQALRPGEDYTLALTSRGSELDQALLRDTTAAPPPGMAKVRFLHASPDAPVVDVAGLDGRPLFLGVHFQMPSLFREVPAGAAGLEVRPAGEGAPIYSIPSLTFDAGTLYTLVAMGLLGGRPELKMVSIGDVVRLPAPA